MGANELLGRSCHATFHYQRADGTHFPLEECPLSGAYAKGETLHVDHDTFLHRDGTFIPVQYSASPLHSDDLHGAVVVFNDISERLTEQRRVERELEKLNWVGRLRDALDQDRLVLYAQPIIDLASGSVVQHELLIRMVSPTGEIVLPELFLPTAEEYGLITEIDIWVVGQAARWASQGHLVEFNLSARSVMDPEMLTVVRNALQLHCVPPGSMVCEITETALVRDIDAGAVFVRALTELGCAVALDDFGVGYGGFAYVKRLPVSYLKIDQEFVRDLRHEESSRHVVDAVVSLARAFSLQTVAEGAEDEPTLEVLKELGVDYAQGYAVGRPEPVRQVFRDTNN